MKNLYLTSALLTSLCLNPVNADTLVGVADLVEQTANSVVSIYNEAGGTPETLSEDFQNMPTATIQESVGTGFFISDDGNIVTNYHVIKNATNLLVALNDGTYLRAKVIGADPDNDIAVLDVEGNNFSEVEFADSDGVRVGEAVMAIGSPFGLVGSVSTGIVSGKSRTIENGGNNTFIQTDAAINMGNSGGPLFNKEGKVVGVNTALFSQTGGSVGIGFSIESNRVQELLDAMLIKEEAVGYAGISIDVVPSQIAEAFGMDIGVGVLVVDVTEGSPAEAAGLQIGDILLEYNAIAISKYTSLPILISNSKVGEYVPILVQREGEMIDLRLQVGSKIVDTAVMLNEVSDSNESDILAFQKIEEYGLFINSESFIVEAVEEKSQAFNDGFRAGDEVIKIGITNDLDLYNLEESLAQWRVTLVQILRNETKSFIAVR